MRILAWNLSKGGSVVKTTALAALCGSVCIAVPASAFNPAKGPPVRGYYAGGSGNGPNYVEGPITVRAPDPFGLDSDHDGVGCEG